MARVRSLPFQIQVTLRAVVLVLALTAGFLWIVLGQVQRHIEVEGRDGFELLSKRAFEEADGVLNRYVRLLDHLQATLPLLPDLDAPGTMSILAQTLLPYEDAKALQVTLANGEMFYALRVDEEAPEGSAYTVGHIHDDPPGQRIVDIVYYAADNTPLARRRADGRPIPRARYVAEAQRLGKFASPVFQFPGGPKGFLLTASLQRDAVAVGVTLTVALMDRMLGRLTLSENGASLLLDDQQRVVAMRFAGDAWHGLVADEVRLNPIAGLGHPTLTAAAVAMPAQAADTTQIVTLDAKPYLMAWHRVLALPGTGYRILLLAPLEDLSHTTARARHTTWLLALAGLLVVVPLTWFGAGATARRLQALVRDSERIARMDFTPAPALRTGVRELQQLAHAQDAMRAALQTRTRSLEQVSDQLAALIDTGASLVHETDRERLMHRVLAAACDVTRAQSAALFVRDDTHRLRVLATRGHDVGVPLTLDLNDAELRRTSMAVCVALGGEPFVVDDVDTDSREQLTLWRRSGRRKDHPTRSIACLPLRAPDGQVIGVMELFNARDDQGRAVPFSATMLRYAQALAAQAAVALDKHKLIEAQRQMLDALVRTLGDAVDAKSPYTGRHCARVPELAMMLAEEAHAADTGPLAAFGFHSDLAWREFRIGAWLHDCGKITTPEHVIDKATKLETVYNRLHEVRMRFEVLLRDARIQALESVLQGRATQQQADAEHARRATQLAQDFAFLAACNQGSEAMTQQDMARVRTIGAQRWERHFDNRIGLSWQEQALRCRLPAPPLPAAETLLADQPWHQVPRESGEERALTNGFQMRVPAYLYDHGEVYNLCVAHGTLTEEERFKVNEHIIHTIRMLENAHFPAPFTRIPEYAGTHHETLDGKGYPRGLAGEQLSIPARIMSIADIFEALTAIDRPYKQGKTLSEAIAILHRMVLRGKIDADLFALFLRSGVYLRYAERFMAPEQIDALDLGDYLDKPPVA